MKLDFAQGGLGRKVGNDGSKTHPDSGKVDSGMNRSSLCITPQGHTNLEWAERVRARELSRSSFYIRSHRNFNSC